MTMIPLQTNQRPYLTVSEPRRGERSPLRLVLTLVALLMFMAAGMSLLSARWNTYDTLHISGWQQYTVQPGDTLWSISVQADPGDRTDVVYGEIERHNGLGSAQIYAGQVLWIPVRGD